MVLTAMSSNPVEYPRSILRYYCFATNPLIWFAFS